MDVPFAGFVSVIVYTPGVRSEITTNPLSSSTACPSTVADAATPFVTVIATVLVTVAGVPESVTVNVYVPSATVLVVVSLFTVTSLVSFSAPFCSVLEFVNLITSFSWVRVPVCVFPETFFVSMIVPSSSYTE